MHVHVFALVAEPQHLLIRELLVVALIPADPDGGLRPNLRTDGINAARPTTTDGFTVGECLSIGSRHA
jgi:hypothetical protein